MAVVEVSPGVELAYGRTGSGPSVILVHGITEDRRAWDPLLEPLAASHDVVSVDLRGHGRSAVVAPFDAATLAADLAALATALGLERPLLIGHSLGGIVAAITATVLEVRGVIDVDQPLELVGFQALVQSIAPALTGDRAVFEETIEAVFEAMAGPLSASERNRLDAIRAPRQEVVLGVWDELIHRSASEVAATVDAITSGIGVPFLAMHGMDPGDDYQAWLHALVPSAVYELWSDHGHYPHLVDPGRFVERVLAFDAPLS